MGRVTNELFHTATATALYRWRTISAFLLQPQRSQRTPLTPSEHAVAPQVAALASAMNTFLQHFVFLSGMNAGQAQSEHLQAVILECTKLGYLLLSHPAEWRFTYQGQPAPAGITVLTVCPGLEKMGDKDGRPYDAPRQVVAPTLAQV